MSLLNPLWNAGRGDWAESKHQETWDEGPSKKHEQVNGAINENYRKSEEFSQIPGEPNHFVGIVVDDCIQLTLSEVLPSGWSML